MKGVTEPEKKKLKKRRIVRIRRKRKTQEMAGNDVKGGRRAKSRGRHKMVVFWFLAVCAVIIVAAFAVLKAPFFSIKAVVCEGQKSLTQEQIMNIAQIKLGANIFATNLEAAENRLKNNPEIAEVKIKRVFPNKLRISVTEAKIAGYMAADGKFLLIDTAGKIVKAHPDTSADAVKNLAKVEGFEPVSQKPGEIIAAKDDARAGELFRCFGILESLEMLDKVNYINFSDLSDLHIEYESRLYMLMGSYDNLEYKLKFVKKVIDENISKYENALLDFRGEKLYVRPRIEEQEELPQENPENAQDGAQTESLAENGEQEEKPTEGETPETNME